MDIRPLTTYEECRACEDVQALAWGTPERTRTAAHLLLATIHAGGIVSGAITPEGRVIGYVYSFPAQAQGCIADDLIALQGHPFYHWSHQMAVIPEYAGDGLATRLKLHQADRVRAQGLHLIMWTFSPMMSVNAHLNLTKLGALTRTYRRSAYGPMTGINAGLPSDRFDAEWWLNRDTPSPAVTLTAWRKAGAILLNPGGETTLPLPGSGPLLIVIPRDFNKLKTEDKARALAWQMTVRASMEAAFDKGYAAYHYLLEGDVGYYVLLKDRSR
ncbi:MAG: GNAT family N-acetyltransferase [Anaerolineae bacterium]